MEKIGITTTLPIEVVLAAGWTPVDLNNIFIGYKNAVTLADDAEYEGFPQTICCWTKGIFTAALNSGINHVASVIQGDCINSPELSQVMELYGIKIYPFSFPFKPDRDTLTENIKVFAEIFDVSMVDVEKTKAKLDRIRSLVHRIDELTYKDCTVTGFENHLFLVSTSDMKSNPDLFEKELTDFLVSLESRKPKDFFVRLGYIGVPPVCPDIYDFIENIGGKIVFNEIQRQFSMPHKTEDIVSQYMSYTYPYSIEYRIKDIQEQIRLRDLNAIIHYSQAFCSRQLDDIIFRKKLDIPILTIEADKPGPLEPKNVVKLEAFIDSIIKQKKLRKK